MEGCGAENSKLLIMVWSFLWSSLLQKPIQCCLIRTKDAPITQELTGSQEPCIRNWNPRLLEQKMFLLLLRLGIHNGFRYLRQVLGQRPLCLFPIIPQFCKGVSWMFTQNCAPAFATILITVAIWFLSLLNISASNVKCWLLPIGTLEDTEKFESDRKWCNRIT